MIDIGNVNIKIPVALAPMAGVTDLTYRDICREFHCGLTCTELISAKAIKYNNRNTDILLETSKGEHPSMIQLFGSDPDIMGEIAKRVEELDFDIRPNQNLQRIRDMRLHISYGSLPYDPIKGTVSLFLSEFLYYALKHELENNALFLYLCNSLQWFDRSEKGLANFHLVFLMRLTRFLGFWPNVQDYVPGMLFDLRESTMVSVLPAHGQYLDAEESAFLPKLLRMDYATMHLFRFNRQQKSRVLDILVDYYRMHIPEFPELKSLDVLRTVFS